jgi:hypothetical protein
MDMTQLQVWKSGRWTIAYNDIFGHESTARDEAERRANHHRHPYRVVSFDTGRELGRFTGEI